MRKNLKETPLFRAIVRRNPQAHKVLFFVASYKAPWQVYHFAVNRLRRIGYEVVIYDVNDYMLDSDDPKTLVQAVETLSEDIHARTEAYKAKGITVFDGVGNSLGSFLLFNYATRYPIRKIVLNTGGYMARVIFHAKDGRIGKVREKYIANGYDLKKLEKVWETIDKPSNASNLKAEQILLVASFRDKYLSRESIEELIRSIKSSKSDLTVVRSNRLRHTALVITSAHSKRLSAYLLQE